MTQASEHIASCACGKVRFKAVGKPIASGACYCADCQAGGRMMEDAGARHDFRDAWGGTEYLTYGDTRITCLDGASLVQGFKIREDAPTTRFVTTCCNSAIYLKYGSGWWTSLYRVRFGEAAPPLEMRNNVRNAQNRSTLPRDVPTYNRFPLKLFWRLLRARFGA